MSTLGRISCAKVEYTESSLSIDQLTDVDASVPANNHCIMYKENAVDPVYTDGWYSAEVNVEDLSNVNADSLPAHNEILAWNDAATDGAYATGWVNKNITTVFSELPDTVASIANVHDAAVKGREGNAAQTDMVMMTSDNSGTSNLSLGSTDNFNAIYKREITDAAFVFVQSLSRGEIANLTYTTGTIIRSTKGTYGFTGPFPTPLGISSLPIKESRFSTLVTSTSVNIVSTGTEVEVTLFASDGTTVEDGPITVPAFGSTSLACGSLGEFLVKSSGFVLATIDANGGDLRLLPPMTAEILTWNSGCIINSLSGTATVTWYSRAGNTGTISVVSGTPYNFTESGSSFAEDGCVLLRSDKPIGTRTEGDGSGGQSVPGWPADQLAQCFCNPAYMDSTANYAMCAIIIGSPYEGTATVYDSSNTVVASFPYTRTNSVTTAADQMYPACARWKPEDVSPTTVLDGGYVCTSTPATCVMNFSGSPVWADTGEEMILPGTTPLDIKAEIIRDGNGLLRRRDIDGSGEVTWVVC